jgi:ribosomal protein S27AE
MPTSRECPKCGGSMTDGFIADHTYGSVSVSSWVEGEPKRSWWYGVKLTGEKPIEITTWRCDTCGYLESYAQAG